MRLWTRLSVTAAVCCAAAVALTSTGELQRWTGSGYHSAGAMASAKSIFNKQHPLKVMAVGGSSAQGYDDPKLDGYLSRALSQVSTTLRIPITFVNKAKSGDIATMLAPTYDPLVHSIRPDVVIISWGLLNDISKKTPKQMFERVIKSEVSQAIREGADVWIVTPPVTVATYVGHDVVPEQEYAALEIAGAREVHSAHVHVFDLMNAMKKYLKERHESYKPYQSNNWHMNRAGHELAGRILAGEILNRAKSLGLTS